MQVSCGFAAAQPDAGASYTSPKRVPKAPAAVMQNERIDMNDPRPADVSGDIFYHIMPIAWRHAAAAGSDPASQQNQYRFGTFRGIREGIPYLKSLGVTAIWINPIFPSPAYHGYQHDRADRINPWFGSEAEFKELVDACHASDMKVFLDLVAYGISQKSEYFTSSHNNPASGFGTMLAYTDEANKEFVGYEFKTWNGDTVGFVNWDLRRASARRAVCEWSKKWLGPAAGIDGYRLDHVWQTYENGPEGLGYHIDTFWKQWREEVESAKPDVFTFVEQHEWKSFGAELLRTKDGHRVHDAAFTKPFEFAAREAIREEEARKIYLSMAATITACPDGYTFMGIIGDHDVDRLASDIGADEHPGRAKAAAAVLMLQPFPPIIYYGDELGMLGKGGSFNSDANDIPRREPMRWTAESATSPVTSNYFALHEGAFSHRYSKDHDGRSVEEQDLAANSLLNTYRALASTRASHPAIARGHYVPLETDAKSVWCFVKQGGKGVDSVLVAINLGAAPVHAALSPPGPQHPVHGLPTTVEVEAYGWKVIPLKQ